jgi:acetolactate decarboxylase
MKAKKIILILLAFFFSSCTLRKKQDKLFQLSTIDALLSGVYEAQLSVADLKSKGDFGIGTINDLDGELIVLDGDFYQVDSEGLVNKLDDAIKIPFVNLNFFDENISLEPKVEIQNLDSLKDYLNNAIQKNQGLNFFQAIKIHGSFSKLKLRSVPKQKRPYRELKEVVKEQSLFFKEKIQGTLIGYRIPSYLSSVAVTGYHFHFLADDLQSGGHVLDFENLKADNFLLDEMFEFDLELLQNNDFKLANLSKNRSQDLKKVEK